MIKITKIIQTSMACPSQFDMWDENGNYYYVRYRHDWLTVQMGGVSGTIIIEKSVSYGGGGFMNFEELRIEVKDTFQLPLKLGSFIYKV